MLVQSDGNVVAKGMNQHGQCSIPPLEEGMSYAQASAGGFHTVLLRQDGNAVACGDILSCSGVTAMPLLWDAINMDNATFHLSVKTCRTSRSMQVDFIACFFEAMAWLWLPAGIITDNVTFQRSKSVAVSMLQILLGHVGRISFCKWTLPSKTW